MNTSKFRLLFFFFIFFFKYIPKAKFRCWDFISTSFQKHEGKLSPKRQPFLCFHPQTSARLLSRFTPLAHQTHQLFTPPAGPACGPRAALQPTMPMSPCCPPVAMPRSATSLRPPPVSIWGWLAILPSPGLFSLPEWGCISQDNRCFYAKGARIRSWIINFNPKKISPVPED